VGVAVNATPWQLYLRERDPVPIVQEAVWDPGAVWTGAENLAPIAIRFPNSPGRSESLLLHFHVLFCLLRAEESFRDKLATSLTLMVYEIHEIPFHKITTELSKHALLLEGSKN